MPAPRLCRPTCIESAWVEIVDILLNNYAPIIVLHVCIKLSTLVPFYVTYNMVETTRRMHLIVALISYLTFYTYLEDIKPYNLK